MKFERIPHFSEPLRIYSYSSFRPLGPLLFAPMTLVLPGTVTQRKPLPTGALADTVSWEVTTALREPEALPEWLVLVGSKPEAQYTTALNVTIG